MALAVANRYARALADAVFAPGSGLEAPAALVELRAFSATLAESADLRNVLNSPAVAVARKRAVITRLGGQLGVHRLVRNFLCVIVDHRRINTFDEIAAAFEALLDERLGRVRAHVSSAAPLSDSERAAVDAQLARLSGKQVRSDYHVDPGLLGGVLVRIASTIYDGSVRGQLAALRSRLVAE